MNKPGGEPLRILVAGLGNVLLMDDGIGVHAARALQEAPPPGAMVVEVGTAVLDALHLFEAADYLLAIDAMEAGDPPGSVYAFDTDAIADNGVPVSMHELSLVAALRFLPAHHPRPQIAVLGVEPETIEFGLDLTPPVQAALPLVLAEARRIVAQWLTEAGYDPAEVPQSSWLLVAE